MNKDTYQSLLDSRATITVHCGMLRNPAIAFHTVGNEIVWRELETAIQVIQASADGMIDTVDNDIKLNVETDTELITLMAKRFGSDGFAKVTVLAQKSGGKQ